MNILHVLSGDFVSGAETYAASLIRHQIQNGHKVFIAAGSFSSPTEAEFFAVPIFKRDYGQRLKNIWALIRIIRRKKIDIIHAHSRAASWVSHLAARWTKVAYLSTIHGRQHVHASFARRNVYGKTCLTVCENIRDQLLSETRYFRPEDVWVSRNGIEL